MLRHTECTYLTSKQHEMLRWSRKTGTLAQKQKRTIHGFPAVRAGEVEMTFFELRHARNAAPANENAPAVRQLNRAFTWDWRQQQRRRRRQRRQRRRQRRRRQQSSSSTTTPPTTKNNNNLLVPKYRLCHTLCSCLYNQVIFLTAPTRARVGDPRRSGSRSGMLVLIQTPPPCKAGPDLYIWPWVKNMCPKRNPGKWKNGPKPVVRWWFNFDPYPYIHNVYIYIYIQMSEAKAGCLLQHVRFFYFVFVFCPWGIPPVLES